MNSAKWISTLILWLMFVVSRAACAAAPDYTYMEFGIGKQSGDNLKGLYSEQVAMSAAASDHFFLYGRFGGRDYGGYRYSNRREHVTQSYAEMAGGANFGIQENADAVLRAGFLYTDTSEGGFRGDSRTALSVGAGVRWLVTSSFELSLFYDRNAGAFDPSGLASTFGDLRAGVWQNVISPGIRWHITEHATVGITSEYSDFQGQNRTLLIAGYYF
ncbi:MAG: hypothetical protein ACM3ZT_02595 [Bacillota bacterium]